MLEIETDGALFRAGIGWVDPSDGYGMVNKHPLTMML